MKTDFQITGGVKAKEILLSCLIFGDFAVALVGGGVLVGVLSFPQGVVPWIGGAILGYGVVRIFGSILTSVKRG